MANFRNRILQTLQNNKNIETILDDLSTMQENLLKNHSNPAFNNKDKNKILKGYMDLQNLGKSLERYGRLKENNYLSDAQEERREIEDIVLKGGISYYKYFWEAENSENTCDKCKELDGQVFEFEDEVPERPHPNCKCKVKVIEAKLIEISPPKSEVNPPQPLSQGWIMPCNGPITSLHGYRIHPVYGTKKLHDGIDIGVPLNTAVQAAAEGTIKEAKWYNGYGNYIEIDHGNNIISFYGHLTSFNVKKGDSVKQGQIIAKSGNTGIGTGAHLHFGVHKNNISINPLNFIRKF